VAAVRPCERTAITSRGAPLDQRGSFQFASYVGAVTADAGDLEAVHPEPSIDRWAGIATASAIIPWAAFAAILGVACFTTLSGTSDEGEEGITVVFGLLLLAAAGGLCRATGKALTRLSRRVTVGLGFMLAALIVSVWVIGWSIGAASRGESPPSELPVWTSTIVLTGFTLPVALVGLLATLAVALLRRRR